MLARGERLSDEGEKRLRDALARHWKANSRQDLRAAAWLENGGLADEENRAAIQIGKQQGVDDPVLQTQALLRKELGELFTYSRAVCYGFEGKMDGR